MGTQRIPFGRGKQACAMGSDARDPVKHMLCDLDGTLYRSDALNKGVEKHIADYLVEFCGMTEEEADKGRYDLYKGHGLTVGGLVAKGYDVDFDHWHSYVVGRRAGGCCCCVC